MSPLQVRELADWLHREAEYLDHNPKEYKRKLTVKFFHKAV